MTNIRERQHVRIYIYKSKKCETFLYTKSETLFKKQDNLRFVFIYKIPDTLHYAILQEISDIGIYRLKA